MWLINTDIIWLNEVMNCLKEILPKKGLNIKLKVNFNIIIWWKMMKNEWTPCFPKETVVSTVVFLHASGLSLWMLHSVGGNEACLHNSVCASLPSGPLVLWVLVCTFYWQASSPPLWSYYLLIYLSILTHLFLIFLMWCGIGWCSFNNYV